MRSFVVRKVMRKSTTQIDAHRPMVICQPLALSPCPNLATSGKVNPPTINCAIIAETKRNDDRLVRSLTSPVITPVMAEYGVLLAEYSVISMMLVTQAYTILPVAAKFGVVYATTITTPHGSAVHKTHGRNLPQRVLVRSAIRPIMGSKNASQSRPTSSNDPATAATIPIVSV